MAIEVRKMPGTYNTKCELQVSDECIGKDNGPLDAYRKPGDEHTQIHACHHCAKVKFDNREWIDVDVK